MSPAASRFMALVMAATGRAIVRVSSQPITAASAAVTVQPTRIIVRMNPIALPAAASSLSDQALAGFETASAAAQNALIRVWNRSERTRSTAFA